MPELPEVETVARDLRGLVLGATITGARVAWARTLREPLDPGSFAAGVAGRRIEAVGRRGKQLVVALTGEAVLTIHLKMTGQLFVVPAGAPADAYVRLVLELGDGREVRFRDIRKFGRVGLYGRDPATGEPIGETGGVAPFARVGPEPLDPTFTLRDFRRRLRSRRGRLKSLLTDQSFLAGIGNIYADEALWAARLHPLRPAGSLRPPDETRLYRELRRVLAEAVARRGSSIDDYTAPEGDGAMQERLQVYQRTAEACPRCGRPIRRIVVGARSTHFCSWCQRLRAAEREGAATILGSMTPRSGGRPSGGPRSRGRPSGGAGSGRSPRRGTRWVELAEVGALGLTEAERQAAQARTRTDRTRAAAATRRAAARRSAQGGTLDAGPEGAAAGGALEPAPASPQDAD